MEFIVFSQLTCDEKEKLKNELCNVIVDKTSYEQAMHFKNCNAAIQNMRKNINSSFCPNDKNLVLNMEIILSDSLNEDFFSQPVNLNEEIVSAIIAMRPEYSEESIRGAVTKAQKIVKNNAIVPGFDSNKRFVKSSSSHQPHTVSKHWEGCLTWDKDCKHFKEEKYCAHVPAVAVNENIVEEFAKHLEKQKAPSLNSIASANINTSQVGKKKPACIRDPVVKKLSNLGDAFSNNFRCGEN